MHVQNETQLTDFQGWTLRMRPGSSVDGRLLVLLHGWTGDENSMWVFARNLSEDYWIVAPRAPHPARPSGFSWRARRPEQRDTPTLEDLRPSAQALLTLLDEWSSQAGLAARPWSVMGFSQGSAMACAMAFLFPERIERLALLAGFTPRGAEPLVASQPLNGKKVFIAHGSLDQTVDIEWGRSSARLLEKAGAQIEVCEDAVGHKVSVGCLRRLERFFA